MGMFDYYQPDPPQLCPVCGHELSGWQGKDAEPCVLFLWRQGFAAPVDHRVDEEFRIPVEARGEERLPDEFLIYTDCEGCARWIDVVCKTENGVWVNLQMPDADTVIRDNKEPQRRQQLTAARARDYVNKKQRS